MEAISTLKKHLNGYVILGILLLFIATSIGLAVLFEPRKSYTGKIVSSHETTWGGSHGISWDEGVVTVVLDDTTLSERLAEIYSNPLRELYLRNDKMDIPVTIQQTVFLKITTDIIAEGLSYNILLGSIAVRGAGVLGIAGACLIVFKRKR